MAEHETFKTQNKQQSMTSHEASRGSKQFISGTLRSSSKVNFDFHVLLFPCLLSTISHSALKDWRSDTDPLEWLHAPSKYFDKLWRWQSCGLACRSSLMAVLSDGRQVNGECGLECRKSSKIDQPKSPAGAPYCSQSWQDCQAKPSAKQSLLL